MTCCIFRTDRIGDVLLTLPLASALKQWDEGTRVLFVVQEYTAGLVALCPDVDQTIAVARRDVSVFDSTLPRLLNNEHIDAAIFAYPRPGLTMAAARARIPVRVGTAWRWYSGLFTQRRREHRRGGSGHERDYNLALLEHIGVVPPAPPSPRLIIPEELRHEAEQRLSSLGIDVATRFIVLHPGSGGSALDWPVGHFSALASKVALSLQGVRILVTGTQREEQLQRAVSDAGATAAVRFPGEIPLPLLAAVLQRAEVVVGNSTGPLHLASALGRPVLGLYPFRPDCHPRRWGPSGEADVFTPQQQSDCVHCRKGYCTTHDDMRRISVQTVHEALLRRVQA
jgi:heptosyltransferase III